MANSQQTASPMFSSLTVTAAPPSDSDGSTSDLTEGEVPRLLRDILAGQDRQNELLEELIAQVGAAQRQRNQEMATWKAANPKLVRQCRAATEALGRVQTAFLEAMAAEINATADDLAEGDFVLSEFIDRFGPRLAHLNGMLQVLAQLGSPAANA